MFNGMNTTSKKPTIRLLSASKKCSDKDALVLKASGSVSISKPVEKEESHNADRRNNSISSVLNHNGNCNNNL